MSQSRSLTSFHRKKRGSKVTPTNQWIQYYLMALQDNMGSTPKVFLDGELQVFATAPETAHNQTQIHFQTGSDGNIRAIRYRLNILEDEALLSLQQLLPTYALLSDLRLEHCSLTYDQLLFIRIILQEYHQIVHLSVAGNPRQPYEDFGHHLPVQGTELKMYSAQLCNLDAHFAKSFHYGLCKVDRYTRNLTHLNLGSNKIADEGAILFASILRVNRFIQALNISDNCITEKGLMALLEPLSKFALSASEKHHRRQLKLTKFMHNYFPDFRVKEDKDKKGSTSTTSITDTLSSVGSFEQSVLLGHPFLNDTYEEDDEVYCPGNNVLMHLNISYNQITANLIEKIIAMLTQQKLNYKSGGLVRVLVDSRKQFPDLMQEMNNVLAGRQTKRPNTVS